MLPPSPIFQLSRSMCFLLRVRTAIDPLQTSPDLRHFWRQKTSMGVSSTFLAGFSTALRDPGPSHALPRSSPHQSSRHAFVLRTWSSSTRCKARQSEGCSCADLGLDRTPLRGFQLSCWVRLAQVISLSVRVNSLPMVNRRNGPPQSSRVFHSPVTPPVAAHKNW